MDKYSKYGTIYTAVDDLPDENPCKRMTGRCALRGRCFLRDTQTSRHAAKLIALMDGRSTGR